MKTFKYVLTLIFSIIVLTMPNAIASYNIDYFSHLDKNNITVNTYTDNRFEITFPYQGDRITHAEVVLAATDNTAYTIIVAEQDLSCTNKFCQIASVAPIKELINNLATVIIELSTDNFFKEITILNKLVLITELPKLQLSFDTASNTFEHKITTTNGLITYNTSIIPTEELTTLNNENNTIPTKELTTPDDEDNTIPTDELIPHDAGDNTLTDLTIKKNNTTSAIIAGATALLTGTTIVGGILIKKNITKNQIALTTQVAKNQQLIGLYDKQQQAYTDLQNSVNKKQKEFIELQNELASQKEACIKFKDKAEQATKDAENFVKDFNKQTAEKMIALTAYIEKSVADMNQKKLAANGCVDLIRRALEEVNSVCTIEQIIAINNKLQRAIVALEAIESAVKFSSSLFMEITTKFCILDKITEAVTNIDTMMADTNYNVQLIDLLTKEALALAQQCKSGYKPELKQKIPAISPNMYYQKNSFFGNSFSTVTDNSPQQINQPNTVNMDATISKHQEFKETADNSPTNELVPPKNKKSGFGLLFEVGKKMLTK